MPPHAPRPAALGALLAAALVALPLGGTPATAASTAADEANESLTITDFAFADPKIRVAVGDTVTWVNSGKVAHVAKSRKAPTKFASPRLAAGESWSHTFTKPGIYPYVCTLHPAMKAIVVVAAAKKEVAAAQKAEENKAVETPVVATAASAPIEAENSAPLLAGSALFVALIALIARARRPAE